MISPHAPEVLRALGERMRRERYAQIRPWLEVSAELEIGRDVHELTRDDVQAAVDAGVLESRSRGDGRARRGGAMSRCSAPPNSGECPECGRDIGLVPGDAGDVLRYHRDVDGDGAPCAGRGRPPKLSAEAAA